VSTAPGGWYPYVGAAYLAPSGPGNYSHLFVILNDPVPFPNKGSQPCVCVVNFSTPPTHIPYDKTCIFQPGSHPFLQHASYAYFKKAEELFARDVAKRINSGIWTLEPDLSAADVQALRNGLVASPQTPRDIKNLKIW
jgi:hypothetical protein